MKFLKNTKKLVFKAKKTRNQNRYIMYPTRSLYVALFGYQQKMFA